MQRNEARRHALAALGKALTRRAGACCELCGTRGSLKPTEIPPIPEDDPDLDHAALLCARCVAAMEAPQKAKANELRFLGQTMWSEVVPVQLAAVRLLKDLASGGESWAIEALDGLYLDPEIEALV